MKDNSKRALAVSLCLLMFSTPLATINFLANILQQPKIYAESFSKIIEVEGKSFNALYFSKITQYTNGTRTIHLSIAVENLTGFVHMIRMNLTKTITSEELENLKRTPTLSTNPNLQFSTTENPYNIPEYLWDGLCFVLAGTWNGYWIKYDHDNNLWRYYPIFDDITNLDLHWDMTGIQRIHSHIARRTLQDWISGNISDEEAMRKIIGTRDLIISIIGGIAISLFSYLYLSGLTGLIIGIVASLLISLILWLLSLLGVPKSQWLVNVVQAEMGDGFCWAWDFRTKYFNAYHPDIGWLSLVNEYSAPSVSEKLAKYHRLELLCYEQREFKMTWGSERDASPQTYTAELWYDTVVPAGIFADYSAISK